MQKKWSLLHKEGCPYNISIEPVKREYLKERGRNFKGIIIKGWTGHFYLKGDKELIELSLDTGLSTRNSAGFGMIEVVKER